jgi:hypothetical protein
LAKRNSSRRLTAAARRSAATALKAHEALGAAAGVIAARAEMTALAVAQPSAEANAELGLMVTEKVAAFSEAAAAVAAGAADLAGRNARYAAEEAMAATRAMARIADCRTPAELMGLHGQLITDFWGRSLAHGLGLNAVAVRTGEKALAPVHKTVTANHRRLTK